jgi:hypothetical protein
MMGTRSTRRRFASSLACGALPAAALRGAGDDSAVRVEAEETVYEFTPADNGAGPLWSYGAPLLVRHGEAVLASGLETIPGVKPLHNCRWTLHRRESGGWRRVAADEKDRQREPCPIAVFSDGRLLLSSNPTLAAPDAYNGPADPCVLSFDSANPGRTPAILRPAWSGAPRLTEHTYRGLAADARNRELLVLHNDGTGTPVAHWSFLDRAGAWRNQGVVRYPVRGCYPQIALRERAAHIVAVGDIVEPVAEWRKWKFEQSGGRQWDYVFRRLFYCSSPDVAARQFGDTVEIANVDATAGHITNLDLWLDRSGAAHVLYLKRSVASATLRDRFFPGTPVTVSLEHAVIRDNRVTGTQTLMAGGEGAGPDAPAYARLHATPAGRLLALVSVVGKPGYANRIIEILPGNRSKAGAAVDLRQPFVTFMTATERGGSQPSDLLDVMGICEGSPRAIRYARIKL